MNIVDLILIIILIAAAIRGFIKGFFVEFASVAALVLGVVLAMAFTDSVKDWLATIVHWRAETVKGVAFFLVFVAVVVIVHIIANILEKFVRAIFLGVFSSIGGAIFGVIKTAFILSFFMYIVARIEDYDVTIIPKIPKKESKMYAPIEKLAPNLLPFLRETKKENEQKVLSGV